MKEKMKLQIKTNELFYLRDLLNEEISQLKEQKNKRITNAWIDYSTQIKICENLLERVIAQVKEIYK